MSESKMKIAQFVTLPDRNREGYLNGTKEALVIWECPSCGKPMGQPILQNFYEDGQSHAVHVWKNDCGHVAKYEELQVVME